MDRNKAVLNYLCTNLECSSVYFIPRPNHLILPTPLAVFMTVDYVCGVWMCVWYCCECVCGIAVGVWCWCGRVVLVWVFGCSACLGGEGGVGEGVLEDMAMGRTWLTNSA
eukprot:202083-Amorphochlora_amoeboformis.AAC.1